MQKGNFGLSGQYDNFLCLTKECKQREKEQRLERDQDRKQKKEMRTEKERLKLEAIRLKNEDKKANIESKRSQTQNDTATASSINAQMNAPLPAPASGVEKKDNTMLYIAAGVAALVLTGVVILVVKKSSAKALYASPIHKAA